jgi:cobalt-zinc-cadmium efflux system outer membrane protein
VALTLQQAIALARAKNPSLLSAQQHVSATKAGEVTAGLRQNPNLTLSGADVTLAANNPGNPYSYSANLSRLFERGQKRRCRLDRRPGPVAPLPLPTALLPRPNNR